MDISVRNRDSAHDALIARESCTVGDMKLTIVMLYTQGRAFELQWHHCVHMGRRPENSAFLQADLMVNVDTLLADTQSLLARLQEAGSGGAEDDAFFAADPSRSMSLRQPSPEPQLDPSLPASASSSPEESATDEVYEFQVGDAPLLPRVH